MSLFLASSSSTIHEPLRSLPPSPTEEDLGGASLWQDDDDDETLKHSGLMDDSVKGKERVREISLDEGESEDTHMFGGGYPPLKDEEEEARKVEENLKRLGHVDRQRRKAARDCAASTAPSSVVNNISRHASLLLSGRLRSGSKSNSVDSSGSRRGAHAIHTQLGQSSEEALPLSELHSESNNMLLSPANSKSSSLNGYSKDALSVPPIVDNPFEPPDSATPLRGFPDEDNYNMVSSAVMRPSSPPPLTPTGPNVREGSPFDEQVADRPTLQATSSFSRPGPPQMHHPLGPPPLPLDLPPPKTPPPRAITTGGTPFVSSPPKHVPVPSPTTRGNVGQTGQDSSEQEHRWWTDWLCGCREGKDRDNAGRTNPFE